MINVDKYEQQLKEIGCDIQKISFLQRKNLNRLQAIKRSKQIFIRSLNDRYKSMRLILIALTIQIYTYRDTQRIHKFKSIVYQSNLKEIAASNGLMKEQLHKIIAVHLVQIQPNSNVQNQLIRMFNTVSFFDQILMISFKQYFRLHELQKFEIWLTNISRHFQVNVRIIEANTILFPMNKMHLLEFYREQESFYLLSNTQNLTDSMEDSSNEEGSNGQMFVSIKCIESPLLSRQNSPKKQLIKALSHQNISEKQPQPKKKDKKPNSLWSIFCCSVD